MLKGNFQVMLAAAVVALMVSSAMAQPEGGGRRGGRGGFGGGFGGFGVGGLVAMPEVQKELGLSEADAKKLTDALQELRPQRGEGGGNREGFRNLSEEEREKRMAEFRKQGEEIAKKSEEKIKSSLTDAQWKRLNELRVQREGTMALERTEIADKLKLTSDQKEKIKTLNAEGRPQFGRGGPGGGGSNAGGGERPSREEMQARRDKRNADILAVLTPEQKTAFENLKGAKFEFPERQFGGPGGGRRGGRPAAE